MKNFFEKNLFNTKLYESKNFVVVPSLGAMIEGWLLVVPKEYSLNMALLESYKLEEITELVDEVERDISKKLKKDIILFEHGPSMQASIVGCGVDYAHLHIVPCEYDLLTGLNTFLDIQYDWNRILEIKSLAQFPLANNNYLYYRNQKGDHFLAIQEEIPSQLFRRVIAHCLNTPNKFDWKEYPCLPNIQNTILQLSNP